MCVNTKPEQLLYIKGSFNLHSGPYPSSLCYIPTHTHTDLHHQLPIQPHYDNLWPLSSVLSPVISVHTLGNISLAYFSSNNRLARNKCTNLPETSPSHVLLFMRRRMNIKGTRLACECITVWQGTTSGGMRGLCQPAAGISFTLRILHTPVTSLMWAEEHIVSVNTTHPRRQVSDVHRMACKFQKVRGIPVCEALDSKHNWMERKLHIQSDYLTYLI